MKQPQNTDEFLDNLKVQISQYVDLRIKLLKLDLTETGAKISGQLFAFIIILLMLFMMLLFGSLVIAFALSTHFNNYTLGFGIVACIHFAMLLILLLLKNRIFVKPVANLLVKIIYKSNDD
jgi:uncharacterized membrane protein YkvI